VTNDRITSILELYRSGALGLEAALGELRGFPTADLGYASLDTERELRTGFPEVVYCASKTPEQVRGIVGALLDRGSSVLATRASEAHFAALGDLGDRLVLDRVSRTARSPRAAEGEAGLVAVVCAGTSDLPVAEEAAVTAEAMGARVLRVVDVGVAGLHRLLERMEDIRRADAIVAVAGMEGALASVVAGLVAVPVIAAPTSVGYGASFGGLSALLAMLNSCAAGLSVVNIDNGFGAGYQAALIARPRPR
jgi:pyridinium-3,5-biscarboxylic acid mononucleotide synthase